MLIPMRYQPLRILSGACVSMILALSCNLSAPSALALSEIAVGAGTTNAGDGGGGPPSVHSSALQVNLIYPRSEVVLSLVPGIFYAWRMEVDPKWYLSAGLGLMASRRGLGFGVGTGIGYRIFCYYFCLGIDLRQALGISLLSTAQSEKQYYMISTYSLRFITSLRF